MKNKIKVGKMTAEGARGIGDPPLGGREDLQIVAKHANAIPGQ